MKERVLAETALSCAVGIGQTKLQAKTATGFAKPGGIARLTEDTWIPTMGEEPVTALNGIGARTRLASPSPRHRDGRRARRRRPPGARRCLRSLDRAQPEAAGAWAATPAR